MGVQDWIQTIAIIVTLIGLIITIQNNRKQNKKLEEQQLLTFFSDYTKRYQEIILNLPENINDADFSFEKLPKEIHDRTMRYMRAYYDLCSEEYHLWKSKHVDEQIWQNWESGMRQA